MVDARSTWWVRCHLLLLDELGLQQLLLELQYTSHPVDHLQQNMRGKKSHHERYVAPTNAACTHDFSSSCYVKKGFPLLSAHCIL